MGWNKIILSTLENGNYKLNHFHVSLLSILTYKILWFLLLVFKNRFVFLSYLSRLWIIYKQTNFIFLSYSGSLQVDYIYKNIKFSVVTLIWMLLVKCVSVLVRRRENLTECVVKINQVDGYYMLSYTNTKNIYLSCLCLIYIDLQLNISTLLKQQGVLLKLTMLTANMC